VSRHLRFHDAGPHRTEGSQRSDLILAHEATIADNVGCRIAASLRSIGAPRLIHGDRSLIGSARRVCEITAQSRHKIRPSTKQTRRTEWFRCLTVRFGSMGATPRQLRIACPLQAAINLTSMTDLRRNSGPSTLGPCMDGSPLAIVYLRILQLAG
jgi:hypothetical protein